MSVQQSLRKSMTLVAMVGAGCAAQGVQVYEGAHLPSDQVVVLWTNPHLEMDVDRTYSVSAEKRAKAHRLEVLPGHHAVEVRCFYTDSVPYHLRKAKAKPPMMAAAAGDVVPPPAIPVAPPVAPVGAITVSPTIALLLDGQPGHSYKVRAHFERTAEGIPGCHVKMVDLQADSDGPSVDLY